MNKNYVIKLEHEGNRVRVYLVPHNINIESNNLFNIKIGYIDLEGEPNSFYCLDSDRMTLGVMESIISAWKVFEQDRNKMPI